MPGFCATSPANHGTDYTFGRAFDCLHSQAWRLSVSVVFVGSSVFVLMLKLTFYGSERTFFVFRFVNFPLFVRVFLFVCFVFCVF